MVHRIPKKLQGQTAIVTGGGRGIGAASAKLLAAAGAAVVVVARSSDEIEGVAAEIRQSGGDAIAVPCDVSDPAQIEEAVESAIDQFGRVDILLNNAGIIWPIDEVAHADPDEWAYNIHVNLLGVYFAISNVLPLMLEQESGRILNITSGAADHVIPGWSAYCTAKAGVNMMTRAVAAELAETSIRINGLSPGMVDTEMQADIRSVDTDESGLDYERFHHAHQTGELRLAEDVARAIYWIVGPWGRNETGRIFQLSDDQWRARIETDLAF